MFSDESRNDLKDYMANALSSATVSTKEVESLSTGQGGSAYPSPSVQWWHQTVTVAPC